jgi:hypothetical protein
LLLFVSMQIIFRQIELQFCDFFIKNQNTAVKLKKISLCFSTVI